MTEDEAKNKWCPFARVASLDDDREDVSARNRWSRDGETKWGPVAGAACIGSACMAWQWEQEANQPALLDWAHGDMAAPAPPSTRQSTVAGFCGLAGKP